MTLPEQYNNIWLARYRAGEPPYNDAAGLGVKIERHNAPGVGWRCVGVHHLTPAENGGKQHVYVDVLDEAGNRMVGARLRVRKGGPEELSAVVDKPWPEPGTNIPMWCNDTVALMVSEPARPSDWVSGMHPRHTGQYGNSMCHNSFYVVFVAGAGGAPPEPEPEPCPDEDKIRNRAIDDCICALEALR